MLANRIQLSTTSETLSYDELNIQKGEFTCLAIQHQVMPPPGIPGRSDPGHHSFSNPRKVPRSQGPKVSAGGALEVRMRARDCYWAAEQVGASAATGLASAGDPFNPRVLSVINLSGHTFILDRPPLTHSDRICA